ncbi:MAG: hypothetical protein HC800_11450 [Phormidesmis sp. RL_2_1]|nr:hypothetical protein [Phormidesmis sp. RL_2_1]
MSNTEIRLSSKSIFKTLVATSFLIIGLSLISAFFRIYFHSNFRGTAWLFDVSGDTNIPTWYASITLLFCALLLSIIGWIRVQEKERYAKDWLILAGIFVMLSVDEVATIHEWIGNFVSVPVAKGFLNYGWVILGLPLVVLIGLYFRRFLKKLPSQIRHLFLFAAGLYVGGALGIEIVNAKLEYIFGYDSLIYTLVTAVEELCEMLGVAIFTYSLLTYLEKWVNCRSFQVHFKSK